MQTNMMVGTVLALLCTAVLCRENAVIVVLCRNEEMDGINRSIKNLEERFNARYDYPYVFLNDKEFTDAFKSKLGATCRGRASFGRVEPEAWRMPAGIDRARAAEAWEKMKRAGVPYADVESYHNMCRFFSRSFYKHPLVKDYDYYWRVEPNVHFHCDIDEDPFEYLRKNNKKYGFVITIYDFMSSIPTLGQVVGDFVKKYYNELRKVGGADSDRLFDKNKLSFMFDGGEYNGCHFWSNFEIASFSFLRSKMYNDLMDALEKNGGFYYERWGDAPVHSI
ncbi:alpha 1,2-mannosyltransferase, partial [Pancytospora philotis]